MVVKETLGPSDYCLSLKERREIIQILLATMNSQQKQQWFNANMDLAKKYFEKAMRKKPDKFRAEVVKFEPMTYTSEWSPFQKKKHKICVDAKSRPRQTGSFLNFFAEFCPVVDYKIRSVLLEAEMGQIDNQCNSKKPGQKQVNLIKAVSMDDFLTGKKKIEENITPCYCCGLPIIEKGGDLNNTPFGSQCDHMYPVTELSNYALLRHVSMLDYIKEYFGGNKVDRDSFISNWYLPIHGGSVDINNLKKKANLKNDSLVAWFPEGGGPQMGELMKWMHPACNEDKSNNPWYAIKWNVMKGGRMMPTINPNYKDTKKAMIDGKNINKTLTNLTTGKGRFAVFHKKLLEVKDKGKKNLKGLLWDGLDGSQEQIDRWISERDGKIRDHFLDHHVKRSAAGIVFTNQGSLTPPNQHFHWYVFKSQDIFNLRLVKLAFKQITKTMEKQMGIAFPIKDKTEKALKLLTPGMRGGVTKNRTMKYLTN